MVITAHNLHFQWRSQGPEILHIPQLAIEAGERVLIRGASGSGKSTLLSLLAGITVPTRGSIRVLGQSLETLDGAQRDHFRADHIGYLFQLFNLLPYLSVLDNVILPCRFSRRRKARALCNSTGLETEARRLLEHLDLLHADLLERPVHTLSVGQQQRAAAARALMGSPELLIADEPTSALDADRREAFVRLLFEECAAAGSTLVFVSHDHALESLFDRSVDLAEINRIPGAIQ